LEYALVGALKGEESLETTMKPMAAENEQLKLLVKQVHKKVRRITKTLYQY